jgi:penicillin-binding protein 2
MTKTNKGQSEQFITIAAFFIIILLSFAYLIQQAFVLTIQKGKIYSELSETNSVGKEPVFGERGLILDKNGTPLVVNQKTYDIFINSSILSKEDALKHFPTFTEKIDIAYSKKTNSYVILIQNVAKEIVVAMKEKNVAGVDIRHSYARNYPYSNSFAHLLGYTGIVSEDDLASDSSLINNSIVGKTGLEYQYETALRGELRYDTYEKDALGNPVSTQNKTTPHTGKTLMISIDKKQQDTMYAQLQTTVDKYKAKGGAGVIINVRTGELLAMASYPAYNPNEFTSGISQKSYSTLINNPQSPLMFRPIAAQEPPGSTFKTIVAAAALDSGAIDQNTIFNGTGVITLAGNMPFQDYKKHKYGPLNIRDALMVSSNIFFCHTILALGIDKMLPFAEEFGIGSITNIDLPGEMPGRVPSPENKIALAKAGAYWLDPIWYPEGDSCNSAIGQGIALATPLQMASVAATIANGGTVYKPYLVTKITDYLGHTKTIGPTVIREEIVSHSSLQAIREGMRMGVDNVRGVVSSLKSVPVKVAAKTGTAEFGLKDENGYSTAHAWVIGFYPYDDPQYAFAILIEGGGTSSVASFAMRDFLNEIY